MVANNVDLYMKSRKAVEADVSAGSVEDLAYGVDNALAIGSGLPQNLGKRSAFPTDTLKTLARFQQLPQAYYSLVFLKEEKMEGWS
jgi:hypothetical protein